MFAFKTSTLIKDNIVIKNEDDLKGTKGDFIFKVYAEKEKQNLLLSVMCETKSEQLNSHNKKKNNYIPVYLLFFVNLTIKERKVYEKYLKVFKCDYFNSNYKFISNKLYNANKRN